MTLQIQPTPPPAAIQQFRWIKPALSSILAVGMFFNWGASHARAQGDYPADQTPAVIIDNMLQAQGINGGSIAADFADASSSQLTTALTLALDQFPAPNTTDTADNPGYGDTYTPADLINYMLETATNVFTGPSASVSYKSLAPNLVKAAITELLADTSAYSSFITSGTANNSPATTLATDQIIGTMTADAAAILANRLPGDIGGTAAQQSSAVASAIDTLLANSIKADPAYANQILQDVVNTVKNGFTIPSGPTVSGTTLSLVEAVDAVTTTFKGVPAASLLTTASSAITTVGTFFTSTSGTFSANQSFVVALIKAYSSSSYPTLAQVELQAGEAVQTGGPIITATGAAAYVAPIILDVGSSAIAGIAQGAASYLTTPAAQAAFAYDVAINNGGTLGSKGTAAIYGAVLGGVIANNPTAASTLITSSSIYSTINVSSKLGTSGNRINFVDAALAPIAGSNSAITALLTQTIFTGTNFVDEKLSSLVSDFNSLTAGATKAVLADPSAESAVIAVLSGSFGQLLANDTVAYTTSTAAYQTFAALATKNAGTSGYDAFEKVLTSATTSVFTLASDADRINFATTVAGATAGTASVNDATRAQLVVGLLNQINSSNYTTAYQDIANKLQATSDSNKAAFLGTVVSDFSGSTSTIDTLLSAEYTDVGQGAFASPATGAEDVAKLIPVQYSLDDAKEAAAGQGTVVSSTSAAFITDESIANAILSVSTVKASGTAAYVVQQVASAVLSSNTDASLAADAATFATGVVATNQSGQTKSISQGVASALTGGDTAIETYAEDLAGDLLNKNPDQVAAGAALALTGGASDFGALVDDVVLASGSTSGASLRAKIGAAVAFDANAQAYAGTIVTDLISGDGGILLPLSVLGDKTSIATAVTVQDPSAAGAIAAAEVATLSTDNGGIADIGSVTASISKSIALTNSLANRTSWIANVVTAAINQSTVGGTAISSTSNTINFLNKAAGAGANVGNLISEAVASDITSLVGFSSSNDSSALNTFLAATGKAAGGNTVYIAEGFAQYLTGVNPVTFATNVATASGTTSAAASIKAVVAEGVALADPSGAPAIATDVAATITDSAPANPNQAQAKLEDADNGLRATIAEDVAKAVPALAYDIAYDVGLQLDNTGSADASFATFTKGIISAVDGALPKPGLAAQLGAITSEVLLAASQNANALTETQVVNLIEAAATVKGGTAYEIVGAAIATVAATPALLADVGGNLTSFESVLLTAFNATNNSTTETEAANAKKTYGNNSDYFSVGSVTQPETGITNI